MNTLLVALLSALRDHRWLRLLGCAFILSSVGNGLTQVVVYSQLLRWHVSPAILTLAYLLATLPGFLGSLLGEKMCRRYSPFVVVTLAEILGLVALGFPAWGITLHNLPAMLVVQSAEALFSGMIYPALTLIFKRGLKANELPAATALETLIFAAQVLLGVGLGVMIINRFSLITLLVMDAFSFIFSAILLMFTARHFIKRYVNESRQPAFAVALKWRECSPLQRRSMLLLPLLAAVGTPVMALMPALAQQIRPDETTGLALPLLLARSLGQVCGPLLLNSQKLRQHAQSNLRLVGYLSTFLAGYFLLPALATWNLAALGAVFIAHLASNVVFALGTFSLLNHFSQPQAASASGIAWRAQILVAAVMSLIAAGTAEIIGAINALYVVSLPGILGVVIVLKRSGR